MKKTSPIDLLHKLKKSREEIDLIDQKLITLLNQRLLLAMEIGKIKKEMREKIYDPKREKDVLEKLKKMNKGPLRDEDLKKIFRVLIKVCRQSQIKRS